MIMQTITHIQHEVTAELSQFNTDTESTLFYLIKQGKQLLPIPSIYKTDEHMIKGCHSKVWLAAVADKGKIYFYADSNTAITKGLVGLLVRILDGQSAEAILKADLYFMQKNCLERFIGNERSNGFAAIIRQMKVYADQFNGLFTEEEYK
jgi:cysteine desulfuration protein SufE